MNVKEIIKRTDKRILILLVILFFGVGYSVYRAIDALSADQTSPEYRRSPPGAFAVPATDTIVENNKLEEIYLPDDIYLQVKSQTDLVMNKIISKSLMAKDLTRYGLPLGSARRFVLRLRSYPIMKNSKVDPFFTVQANLDSAPVSANRVITSDMGEEIYEISFIYTVNSNSLVDLYSLNIN
jgi:hypothetical protein